MSRTAVFVVRLSRPSTRTITVSYATVAGTATPPDDFTPASGTLTFDPGETAKQITIPIRDAQIGGGDEQMSVVLSGPVNVTLTDASGTLVIPSIIETTPPVVSISNASVA